VSTLRLLGGRLVGESDRISSDWGGDFGRFVDAVAAAIPVADARTDYVTYRRDKVGVGTPYLQGVPSMFERTLVAEVMPIVARDERLSIQTWEPEVAFKNLPYGSKLMPRCDVVLRLHGEAREEWAIQFKRIQFVGDNGKNNDYGFQKLFSPYLKDRSLLHDCQSLRDSGLGTRQFVVVYCFRHSLELLAEAEKIHPEHRDRIAAARKVCMREPSERLDPEHVAELVNEVLRFKGLVSDYRAAGFEGAWRHPCGGSGLVFGWEVTPSGIRAVGEDPAVLPKLPF